MYTVAHMKKFVYGKFAIDDERFNIEIMYKVKTIVLLDHYTLMDVAYIYTWKRDAPMRFYFRVKEAPQAQQQYNRLRKEAQRQQQEREQQVNCSAVMTVVHQPVVPLLPLTEIKEETTEPEETIPVATKQFEIIPPTVTIPETPLESLKITLVNKPQHREPSPATASSLLPTPKKRVDNIKLKIDLAKQNSVTIINKEIVNPSKSDKEWKIKSKKDKCKEKRERSSSPLTVPPLTIKAERISPLATNNQEEDKKSLFLKSFALTPTKDIKKEVHNNNQRNNNTKTTCYTPTNVNIKTATANVLPKLNQSANSTLLPLISKRKHKESSLRVNNNSVKKPKTSPPLSGDDFKIKLPPQPLPTKNNNNSNNDTFAVPKLPIKRVSSGSPKRGPKYAPPGSLTPHPHADIVVPPGNRTPITKRYQPILPKAARPNPFANLAPVSSDVNIMLQDTASESTNVPTTKVYGPKHVENTIMGPPLAPIKTPTKPKAQNSTSNNNTYFNVAIMNASKAKGNDLPAGCRTPNSSPSYSPNSPQYSPNYNIPTMPTYKYTPKPSTDYLQSVLAATTNQFANLFPAPPTRKLSPENISKNNTISTSTTKNSFTKTTDSNTSSSNSLKRVYPFSRSPSPVRPLEDAPEKQLKVKSLLTSCNINIPSSLSITITRDDGESTATGSTHPKHKNPVNNYIEILKLPEQTPTPVTKETNENIKDNNKQQQQQQQRASSTNNNIYNKTTTNNSNTNKRDMVNLMLPPPTPPSSTTTTSTSSSSTTTTTTKSTLQNLHNLAVNISKSSPPTPPPPSTTTSTTHINKSPTPPLGLHNFNGKLNVPEKKGATSITLLTTTTTNSTTTTTTTISPEKSKTLTPPNNSNNKSPTENAPTAAKKFRHILPRQNATPIAEVIPPKVTSANIIGTYSSPSGVAVKIHANNNNTNNNNNSNNNNNNTNKKTTTNTSSNDKKQQQRSPTTITPPTTTTTISTAITATSTTTTTSSSSSLSSNKNDMNNKLTTTTNKNNNNNKDIIATQQQQQHELATLVAFKDNLLRAQAQVMQMQFAAAAAASAVQHHPPATAAAVNANAANMFYAASYAAAAQQLQQQQQQNSPPTLSPLHVQQANNPNFYNFQQAFIEQFSRKKYAIDEYMQKYKNEVSSNTATTNTTTSNVNQLEKVNNLTVSTASPTSTATSTSTTKKSINSMPKLSTKVSNANNKNIKSGGEITTSRPVNSTTITNPTTTTPTTTLNKTKTTATASAIKKSSPQNNKSNNSSLNMTVSEQTANSKSNSSLKTVNSSETVKVNSAATVKSK